MIKQIFSATLVLLLALTAIGCGTGTSVMDSSTPTVYDEEEYVYCLRLCRNLKNRCRDPESFSVYGTVSYYVDNQGVKQVRIPFRATNGFGAYITDTAYYSGGKFLGTDSSNYENADRETQIIILCWKYFNGDKRYHESLFNHRL